MKIIVIDEEFPFPLNTGKRIRSFHLTSRLAKEHDLRYVAFGTDSSEAYAACRDAKMNPIPVAGEPPKKSGLGFYCRLGANLFSSLPYSVASHYQGEFVQTLAGEIQKDRPDLIIAEWGPYAIYLQRLTGIPKLIVAHNVETDIWRRYYENESNRLKKWYIGRQAVKMARFERLEFGNAAGVTAVSAHDAATIREYSGDANVQVVENGVDLDYFKPSNSDKTAQRLVFTGSMDWRPNQDSVRYFVSDIWPLFKEKRPGIEAVFVGRNPTPDIAAYDKIDGISITGTVDDVRPYIDSAAVYIVPLRIGGGSRLKILEALAMKKPVVSTSVGAEGLNVTNGTDILLADTPSEFVAAVERLLDDHALAVQLGNAGRRLVEAEYGWDALAEKLNRFVMTLAGSR